MSLSIYGRSWRRQSNIAVRSAYIPKRSLIDRLAICLVLAPICLDYRFPIPTATTLAIYTIISSASVSGTIILIMKWGFAPRSSVNASALVAILFTIASLTSGLLRGQDIFEVIRLMPPLVLCCSALLATSALRVSGTDPRVIWKAVIPMALIGMIAQAALAVVVGRVALSTVRYEILSSAAPVVWGYVDSLILFGGWSILAFPVLVVHFGTIILSVTRTQIVVGLLPIVVAAIATRGRVLERRTIIFGGPAIALGVAAALSIGAAAPDSPMSRWSERLFSQSEHHGKDVTSLTRTGEARFQIQKLQSDPIGLFTGFGIDAPTALDPETAILVEELIGSDNGEFSETGFGHNHYIGTIFVGGLIFGGAFLLIQMRGLVCAAIAIHRLAQPGYLKKFRSIIGFPLAYIAFCAFGTLGGTLGARGSALLLGFTLGMTLWLYEATASRRKAVHGDD